MIEGTGSSDGEEEPIGSETIQGGLGLMILRMREQLHWMVNLK